VESRDPANLEACHLFDHKEPPTAAAPGLVTNAPGPAAKIPSWGTIGQH
jgi:hypothetical protein